MATPLSAALQDAEHRWQQIGEPIADQLRIHVTTARREADNLRFEAARQHLDQYLARTAPERSTGLDRDLGVGR